MPQKSKKQFEAKRNCVLNRKNYNFNQFFTENFDARKRYESTEVDRRIWLPVPSGFLCSISSDITK